MNNKFKERENKVIYGRITPLSEDVKAKCSTAFQDVVNRIKAKHLS